MAKYHSSYDRSFFRTLFSVPREKASLWQSTEEPCSLRKLMGSPSPSSSMFGTPTGRRRRVLYHRSTSTTSLTRLTDKDSEERPGVQGAARYVSAIGRRLKHGQAGVWARMALRSRKGWTGQRAIEGISRCESGLLANVVAEGTLSLDKGPS